MESDWDSLFAGLDAGRFDIVCNGVEVTDERAKTLRLHHPLRLHPPRTGVRRTTRTSKCFGGPEGKTTANSLTPPTWSWPGELWCHRAEHRHAGRDHPLLTAGRIDATLNADVSFCDYLNVHPDADFQLVAQTEDASHVAIPVRKGDSASCWEAINTAIEELRADGTW